MNLKLHEVISLYYELNGLTRQGQDQTSEVISQGILKQKMSLKLKVYLQRLNRTIVDDIKLYEESREELFKKYGQEKDGGLIIPAESIDAFNREHNDLLTAEKEVNVSGLWGDDLTLASFDSIETEEFYPLLFKLIDGK